jgi:hypothetical protein
MGSIRGAVSSAANRITAGRPASLRRGRAFLAVPLVLVNLTAVWGQAGWAHDHVTDGGIVVALLFALSVESIGVYLAWESHEALMADQASAFLRFGSYTVGALVGILNYLHFSAQSFAIGVAFGALSAISPWLWGIWSRARNRTRLAELGLVDIRGVKLSTARKLWHPVRSVRVLSWAAWEGVTDPADAVAGWSAEKAETPEKVVAETGETEPEFVEPARQISVRAPAVETPEPVADTPPAEEFVPEPRRLTAVSPTSPPWGQRARELKGKGVKHATAYRQAKREWHQENEASA